MFIINPYRFSTSSGFVGPYDSYTTNGAAYSLRRMYSTYSSTSPVIAVNRTIGATTVEADVRVDPSTNYVSLNSPISITSGLSGATTLGEFTGLGSNPDGIVSGTTSINIKTWYDQSGNNRNVTQSTPNTRPFIVTNGVLETDGGKVAARFIAPNYLSYTSGSFIPTGTTLFSLAKSTISTGSSVLGIGLSSSGIDFFSHRQSNTTQCIVVGRTTTSSSTSATVSGAANNVRHVFYSRWRTSDNRIELGIDGGTVALSAGAISTAANWNSIAIGTLSVGNVSNNFTGYQQEHLVFFSDQSSNRSAIETIINSY